MNVYTAVANSNPQFAANLLRKYGYKAQGARNKNDLAILLEQLVANEGEQALKDIATGHPDYGLFEELFAAPKDSQFVNYSGSEKPCRCNCGCRDKDYHNFTGDVPAQIASMGQGTALIAAAFLLAVAILVRKN